MYFKAVLYKCTPFCFASLSAQSSIRMTCSCSEAFTGCAAHFVGVSVVAGAVCVHFCRQEVVWSSLLCPSGVAATLARVDCCGVTPVRCSQTGYHRVSGRCFKKGTPVHPFLDVRRQLFPRALCPCLRISPVPRVLSCQALWPHPPRVASEKA